MHFYKWIYNVLGFLLFVTVVECVINKFLKILFILFSYRIFICSIELICVWKLQKRKIGVHNHHWHCTFFVLLIIVMIAFNQLVCTNVLLLFSAAKIFCLANILSNQHDSPVLRLKRDSSTKKADAPDPQEKLVYSTKTQLQVLSPLWNGADDKLAKQFTTLMEEQSYVINSFDVSFHEGLAFFGIDELFVRPIGWEKDGAVYLRRVI